VISPSVHFSVGCSFELDPPEARILFRQVTVASENSPAAALAEGGGFVVGLHQRPFRAGLKPQPTGRQAFIAYRPRMTWQLAAGHVCRWAVQPEWQHGPGFQAFTPKWQHTAAMKAGMNQQPRGNATLSFDHTNIHGSQAPGRSAGLE
jgi:hypothetical protein